MPRFTAVTEIEQFLFGLAEQVGPRRGIVVALRTLVVQSFPGATEHFKYGGLHRTAGPAPFTGFYRSHVPIEINGRASIGDDHGHLEGRGGTTGRKHIKLTEVGDVRGEHIADNLDAAWGLLRG